MMHKQKARRKSARKYKKGDGVTFLFHYAGLTSENSVTVTKASRDGTIEVNALNSKDEPFRFNTKTGKCLNDETWGGASRTLKLM